MNHNRLPAGIGVGFKPQHFADICAERQAVSFFEVHAENYMGAGGLPHAQLSALRQDHALSLHGVGLGIGGTEPLDREHLRRLKALCARYEPEGFSEHLAWTTHEGVYLNDLLPLPLTRARLESVCAHVDETQQALGRPLLLENPATYVLFEESTIPETAFLDEVARRTGCGLLLDVNNVFVSAANHGTDPRAYLAAFPLWRVGEIHLGGHTVLEDSGPERLVVDSHGAPVADPVWALFAEVIEAIGPVATLIEWDNDVPDWPVLLGEAEAADLILNARRRTAA